MDNLTEKEIEVLVTASKSRLMFYFSGISLGSAVTLFTIDIVIEVVTSFSLGGCVMLMIALGFYQYSSNLNDKLLSIATNIPWKDRNNNNSNKDS